MNVIDIKTVTHQVMTLAEAIETKADYELRATAKDWRWEDTPKQIMFRQEMLELTVEHHDGTITLIMPNSNELCA